MRRVEALFSGSSRVSGALWLAGLGMAGLASSACGASSGGSSTLDPAGAGGGVASSGGSAFGAAPGAGGTFAGSGGTAGPPPSGGAGAGGASNGAGGGPGGAGGTPATPPDLSHTMDPITVNGGDEITGVCQSWTLNNDAPLWVNRIVENNQGTFHHSNWIWVADTNYVGPDGTWKCADRGFDQVAAGALGGVFFAQSTQSVNDVQAFPSGAAFQVPAHARIVGDVHLINTQVDTVTTSLHFDVYTVPEAAVKVPLQPMAFTNLNLDIAPAMKTHAHMQCATPQADFDVYYILPHYHVLGTGMQIDVAGGTMAGTSIFQSAGGYGEAMGREYDPPFSVRGATGLGIACDYDNPRSTAVHYGVGDQEMCVALVYTNGKKAGGETISNLSVTDVAGVHQTDGLCVSVGSP